LLILSVPLLAYFIYPPAVKKSENIPVWARKELQEMGWISRNEIIMIALACLALILWVLGNYLQIHATLAAFAVLCLMVLSGVISWRDIVANKAAWNVFLWFGAMVTLAGGLNNVGFLEWFASRVTSLISSYSPSLILVLLLLVFYFIHYLFASLTAHVAAVLTIFLVTGGAIAGIDFPLLTYLLLFSLGLMGILTPYATGPGPIWYGLGYIPSGTFWKLGAIFGIIFITVLILVGIPWIKLWI
jgi:L-tartrate/succinate antiporter